jgi:hypothetical protein
LELVPWERNCELPIDGPRGVWKQCQGRDSWDADALNTRLLFVGFKCGAMTVPEMCLGFTDAKIAVGSCRDEQKKLSRRGGVRWLLTQGHGNNDPEQRQRGEEAASCCSPTKGRPHGWLAVETWESFWSFQKNREAPHLSRIIVCAATGGLEAGSLGRSLGQSRARGR